MRKEDVHIGDRVRIRDYNDMAREFGRDIWGDIPCEDTFTQDMRYLCGKILTVRDIGMDTGYLYFEEESGSSEQDEFGYDGWTISPDMLEPADTAEEIAYEPDQSELLDLLLGM